MGLALAGDKNRRYQNEGLSWLNSLSLEESK